MITGITFEDYLNISQQLAKGEKPYEAYNAVWMIGETNKNLVIMDKCLSETAIDTKTYNFLSKIEKPQIWNVVTEPWCPDAAYIVPVIKLMADCAERLALQIVLKDQHLDEVKAITGMNQIAIPILQVCDMYGKELFKWGARPAQAQKIMDESKSDSKRDKRTAFEEIFSFYNEDKGLSIQKEVLSLLKKTN